MQLRTASIRGLEWALEQEDEAQVSNWGGTPAREVSYWGGGAGALPSTSDAKIPRLREVTDYIDLARYFNAAAADAAGEEYAGIAIYSL